MIRATLDTGDRKVMVLGVTLGNVNRLLGGEPIHVRGEEMAVPLLDVVVMYGQSRQELIDTLRAAGVPITDEMAATALKDP